MNIRHKHRKYFRFRFDGKLYEFSCLPQGYTESARIFTKLLNQHQDGQEVKGTIWWLTLTTHYFKGIVRRYVRTMLKVLGKFWSNWVIPYIPNSTHGLSCGLDSLYLFYAICESCEDGEHLSNITICNNIIFSKTLLPGCEDLVEATNSNVFP